MGRRSIYADSDIVYGVSKAQKYLDELFLGLQEISEMQDNIGIYILRTARVQGMTYWGIQVRITRGMFNMIYDEAELVCLMGHEIGHMVLKHKEQGMAGLRNVLDTADDVTDIVLADSKYKRKVKKQQRRVLETKWSRENEKDADKYGAELAAKAGYDPYAFCDLFERLAARVDMGLAYRLQKLEGSHPALDERAKSLREYLKKKGCKEGEGERNRAQYLKGMSQVHAMRTGEGKKEIGKIQKGIDEEGKKDLKRLDEIFKEVESLKKADNPVSMERFIEIMDEVCAICKKYGVTAEGVFGAEISADGDSFMKEAIMQDSPFWEMFQSVKNAVAVKAGAIFNMLGHMAAGAILVIGDAVDLYELFQGVISLPEKNFQPAKEL